MGRFKHGREEYGEYDDDEDDYDEDSDYDDEYEDDEEESSAHRGKRKGKSDEVQGVVFIMNGYSFSGSKIDRQFSYTKIDAALKTPSYSETKRQVAVQSEPTWQQESHGNELYSDSLGLFTPNLQPEQPEGYPDDYLRKRKKKKQRKIRW